MKGIKTKLTEKQEKWLKIHFKHTKNDVIADRLGVSLRTVPRLARERGLTKSPQFMRKCQTVAKTRAQESHVRNGTYPPKGYIIPDSEKYRFRKGETNADRLGPKREAERIRKAAETMRKTRKMETWRATTGWAYGLPQQTNLRVLSEPRGKAQQRYYLKKCGYTLDEKAGIAYWDGTTRRCTRLEARERNFYRFMPAGPEEAAS